MPELVFFRRGEEVLRFGVDRSRVVLGRGDKSDVMIPDPAVSRQQAVLLYDGQCTTLEDLSGKGTLVSGAAIERTLLIDGSDIALGQWRAIYRERSGGGGEDTTEVTGNNTAVQPNSPKSKDDRNSDVAGGNRRPINPPLPSAVNQASAIT